MKRGTSLRLVRKTRRKKKAHKTDIELLVENWLIDYKIPYTVQAPIGRCHVDVLLSNKTVVEVQGCFWHGCLKCYPIATSRHLAKRIKDRKRHTFLLNAGYTLLLLWGCELKNSPDKCLAKLLKAAAK